MITPSAPPPATPPMMGDNEDPDDQSADAAPTLELSGDMATALTDGKQQGDEFTATVKFRVANVADGEASLEVLDAVPQDDGTGQDDSGAALNSYLASKGAPPPAQ